MIKSLMNSLENKEKFAKVRFDDIEFVLSNTSFSYITESNCIKACTDSEEYYINIRLVKKIRFFTTRKVENPFPLAGKNN